MRARSSADMPLFRPNDFLMPDDAQEALQRLNAEGKRQDQVQYGVDFLYHNRLHADTILIAARAPNILLTLVFTLTVAWWTRRRYGIRQPVNHRGAVRRATTSFCDADCTKALRHDHRSRRCGSDRRDQ